MKFLQKFTERDILWYDIETVRATDKLEDGPLKDAWLYKSRHQNEILKKTGEPVTPEEYYHEKAALYKPFARIACIVTGYIKDDVLRTKAYTGEESELLVEFNSDLRIIKNSRKDLVLGGFNIVKFDNPFVAARMFTNNIAPHDLLDTAHLKPWEVEAVDLAELYKGTSFYPDSLSAVCASFGIPNPKASMEGSEVSDIFYKGGIDKIVEYCTQDVLAVANIYRKFLRKPFVTL